MSITRCRDVGMLCCEDPHGEVPFVRITTDVDVSVFRAGAYARSHLLIRLAYRSLIPFDSHSSNLKIV